MLQKKHVCDVLVTRLKTNTVFESIENENSLMF
jgi:hypothetical protein